MGGGKGGGGTQIAPEVEEASRQLQNIGQQQFELGIPLTELGAEQAAELLAGGQGSLRPTILQALETGRSQGSQAITNAREQATLQGLTGTALQEQLAQNRVGVESEVAGIPASFQLPILQAAAQQAFQLPQQGIANISSGLSGGATAAFANPASGGAIGALSGAAGGALTGAQIGSMVPGVGNAAGAIGGALLGGAKGGK